MDETGAEVKRRQQASTTHPAKKVESAPSTGDNNMQQVHTHYQDSQGNMLDI